MTETCPRCCTGNPPAAHFCRHCGLALVAGPQGFLGAGRLGHPQPLPAPEGFAPLGGAADLFFQWEAAWGGGVPLGTEALAIKLFNAGYPLAQVVLRIRGAADGGEMPLDVTREVAEWPRGQVLTLEIASWELPGPACGLSVGLVAAEFGPDS
jgi:hypothetical protein